MPDERTLKQRIHDGDPLHIGWAALGMSQDEIAARRGDAVWDLVFVDAQHAAFAEADLVAFCERAGALGIPALLRMRHPRLAFLAGNMADLGPLGILVPLVETPATAEEAVEGFYYPPLGKRSWGPIYGYGRSEIKDRDAYTAWWNDHGILALQIETVEAVRDVRGLALPGVDLLLFGSNDLSLSLAANPGGPFGSIEACWAHVVQATAGTGVRVAVGMLPYGQFEGI